jgi:hypothetical protein
VSEYFVADAGTVFSLYYTDILTLGKMPQNSTSLESDIFFDQQITDVSHELKLCVASKETRRRVSPEI